MKKSSASTYSQLPESPKITKALRHRFTNTKPIKQAEELSSAVTPPTQEMINRVNQIGREYPFCVYYKQNERSSLNWPAAR